MKAIYDNKIYIVMEMVNDKVILESTDSEDNGGVHYIEVNLADMRLILNPTDSEMEDVIDRELPSCELIVAR